MLVILDFRGDVWDFFRFEGFVKVAFGLLSPAWLAARWANRIEKVETVGKMLVFVDFRGGVWNFSRFEGFGKTSLRLAFSRLAGCKFL